MGARHRVEAHRCSACSGLHRSFRHKVLPAIAVLIAFLPAVIFVGITAFLPATQILDEILPSYGEYIGEITMALALFASLVAPEALCTDRRTGMLDLYLAGPLDVKRYLAAKWAAVASVMLVMTVGPQLFLLVSYTVVERRAVRSATRRSCCSGSSSPGSGWRSSTPPSRWASRA